MHDRRGTMIHIFSWVLAVLACVGCNHLGAGDPEEAFELRSVQISGTVYDRESGDAIMEATMELCAFDAADKDMTASLVSIKTLSYLKGAYSFRIANPPSTQTWQLKASAPGHKTATMDLFIDPDTPSYDQYFKSFNVESVDFYLETLK